MNILVTGAEGFIGRNLIAHLQVDSSWNIFAIDRENPWSEVEHAAANADFIVHLAGINRPLTENEFRSGNVDLTQRLCDVLLANSRPTPFLLSSSIQATLDNPYGVSKRQAEEVVSRYAEQSGAPILIYRLKNVFGKWCRPNYNSVTATFCHNVARDLPITISDPNRLVELVYVDDVVQALAGELAAQQHPGVSFREVEPSYQTTLGSLAELITSFRRIRQTLVIPEMKDPFTRKLYATYLSYLPTDDFAYDLEKRCDLRGCLAEFVKASTFGQIFVSRTHPGITRGNHYHHTKTEKFLVLEGRARIRFRHLGSSEVYEYDVSGEDFRVVDIPPGYTHSIENIGESELVTLFWANEVFDPAHPDTLALPIMQ